MPCPSGITHQVKAHDRDDDPHVCNPGQCTGRGSARACRQLRLVPGRLGPVVADLRRYGHGDQARSPPTDPGVPYVAPALQQRNSPGRRGNPAAFLVCPATEPDNDGPPWRPRHEDDTSPKRRQTRGVSGDVRHPASRSRPRPITRTALAGPRALQRRQRVDDGAVLLRAARRHRGGQGVLPGVPGAGRRASTARSTRREPWGVWGGELFVHGKIVAQKRKRGRPPKIRPEEQEAQSA